MKGRRIHLRLAMACACILALFFSACQANGSAALRAAENSMVAIQGYFQGKLIHEGIGFFVERDGRVLTQYQTVDSCDEIQAQSPGGKVYPVKSIISHSYEQDMAVLQLDMGDTDRTDAGMGKSRESEPMNAVLIRYAADGKLTSKLVNRDHPTDGESDEEANAPGMLMDLAGNLIGFVRPAQEDLFETRMSVDQIVDPNNPGVSVDEFLQDRDYGICYTVDGVYEGQLRNGEPDGQGVYRYENGDVYEGEHKRGVPDGTGRLTRENGAIYEGDMRDGMPDGEGTFWFADGSRYEGTFRSGLREGNGVQFRPDGTMEREGMWKEDRPATAYDDLFKVAVTYGGEVMTPGEAMNVQPGQSLSLMTEYPESHIKSLSWYFDSMDERKTLDSGVSKAMILIPYGFMRGSSHALYTELQSTDGQTTGWIRYELLIEE